MENRMLNMACMMILTVLLGFLVLNAITGLWQRSILIAFIFLCEVLVYFFARFKKQFRTGIVVNGLISYVVLAINYYLNSGINGPTLFLFFFTLHLLVSGTPNKLHGYWLFLHAATVIFIMTAEFTHPSLVKYTYRDNTARIIDEVATYIVTILFIYQVTRYVRNYYHEEKLNTKEYELKLKAFFDSSADCHVLLNPGLDVLYFNNTARAFIYRAYKKELCAGSNMLGFINPAYVNGFRKNCDAALSGDTVQDERLLTYKELGNIWWHISFVPVWDRNRNIIGLSFNAADVTAVKEQEESLRLKNESLVKIAYIQSHELREPVASIVGLMNLIKDDSKNTDEYLKLIEESTMELDRKIFEIIAQTKGSAGN